MNFRGALFESHRILETLQSLPLGPCDPSIAFPFSSSLQSSTDSAITSYLDHSLLLIPTILLDEFNPHVVYQSNSLASQFSLLLSSIYWPPPLQFRHPHLRLYITQNCPIFEILNSSVKFIESHPLYISSFFVHTPSSSLPLNLTIRFQFISPLLFILSPFYD